MHSITTTFRGRRNYAVMQVPMFYDLPVIGDFSVNRWRIIHSLHQQVMAIHFWTINDEDDMRRLIEQGVDGIITDYPELLMDILAK